MILTFVIPSRHQSPKGPRLTLFQAFEAVALESSRSAIRVSSVKMPASLWRFPSGAMILLWPCEPVVSGLAGALAWTTQTVFSTALA